MTSKKRTPPPRPPKPKPKPVEQQAAAVPELPGQTRRLKFRPAAEITSRKQRAMLVALARLGCVTHAAEVAGVARPVHYLWLKDCPAYAAEADRAQTWHVEQLEAEADRRALEGVLEPVVSGGQVVAWRRRYSDTLLMFRLKALRPETYRERTETKIAAKVELDPPRAITIEERRAVLMQLMAVMQNQQLAEEEHANNGKAIETDPAQEVGQALEARQGRAAVQAHADA